MWPRSTFSGARTSSTCSDSPRSSRSASSWGGIWGSEASGMWLVSSCPAENATAPVAGGRACDHTDACLPQRHCRAELERECVRRRQREIGVFPHHRVPHLKPATETAREREAITPCEVLPRHTLAPVPGHLEGQQVSAPAGIPPSVDRVSQ